MSDLPSAENDALAKAWDQGHMLGEALAYNALADLLWKRHQEVITRAEYRELRAARVAALPHWDTNPHVIPPADGGTHE